MPLPFLPPALVMPQQAPLPAAAKKAFDEAYAALEAGRLPEAVEAYEKALALAPNAWDIWLEYTSALRQAGSLQKAARAGWRTVELGPDRMDSWNNLSNVFMDANALPEAFQVAEEMAKRFPSDPKTLKTFTNLGYTAWTLKDFALADRSLGRALTLKPSHLVAKVDQAGAALSAGRPEGLARLDAVLSEAKKASDASATKWAESLIASAKAHGGVLEAPFPRSWAAEQLSPALRTRPTEGRAAGLVLDDPLPHAYLVKRLGQFRLAMPTGWREDRRGSQPDQGMVDLDFKPERGESWSVKVTALLPPEGGKRLKPELAKGILDSRLGKDGVQLHWIPDTRGAVAWARDPDWKPGKPGDFPYLMSALVQVGPLWVTVSCFWDESSTEPPKPFLDLLASLAWIEAPKG